MTSKKAAPAERAIIPRAADRTKAFIKDWERHSAAGRSDMTGAKVLMMLLIANDRPLPAAYRDHALKGQGQDHRDAHIHGDFLLIYRLEGKGANERIIFVRLGSHSEIFG